ncbi:hypothetical protein K502DRAFT_199254 [Neoconidiobolus thromboides FSU 785]|nr:hypothetical protein K502DRAFT_199254 [Neoconidiobolus thromboides FSU 785]
MSHYCYMLFHSANTFTLGEVLNEVVLPCIKELEKAQEIVQAPPFEEQKVKSRLRSFSTKSLYFDPFNDLIVAMFDTYINSGKIEEHLNKKEILFSTFYTHMHQLSMYNITTHKKFLGLTCLCLNSYFLPRSRSNSLDFGDKDLLNRIFMGVKKLAEISINNFTFSSKIIMRPFYTKVNKCFLCFGENLGYNPKGTCLDKMVNE